MGFSDIISLASGVPKNKIPGSYQSIGNIMLLKFQSLQGVTEKEKASVADAVLKVFSNVDTVCGTSGVEGEMRVPKVYIILSRMEKPTLETVHKEHGIQYKLDVSKVMFSKGNLNERQRLIGMIRPGETVVDMFAGIGYFTLGIAKSSKAAKVVAIEKNRAAFHYLKENLRLNKIDGVKTRCGDCRKIRLQEKADRIVMGYFPGTEKFLKYAFSLLKESGVIHYHNLYHETDLWKKPLKEVEDAARKSRYKIAGIMGRNIVKSYAPGMWHVCLDFGAERP